MSHVLHRTRATSYVYNQFYVHGDEDKSCLREHLRHFQQQHVGGHFFRCLADALSHSWGLSCTEPVTAGCSFKKKRRNKKKPISALVATQTTRQWDESHEHVIFFQTAVESPALDTLSDKHSEAEQEWKKKKTSPMGKKQICWGWILRDKHCYHISKKNTHFNCFIQLKHLAVLPCKLPVSKKLKKRKRKEKKCWQLSNKWENGPNNTLTGG